jgi:endonuclease/exonuclease/phosphatase family metal-dependent hydrolase
VAEFDRSGRARRRLTLPARYLPDGARRSGVRDNLGFESVAVTPSGEWLFAATENALAQDGPRADTGVASPARILRWRLGAPDEPPAEFVYRVEPVSAAPPDQSAFRTNGVVELVALSPTRLIALERQYVSGVGVEVRVFRVDLEGATEVSGRDRLDAPGVVPVRKAEWIDLGDLGVPLDNLEGMALGPTLPDGRRVLVLVADENFDPAAQRALMLAFAVGVEPVSIAGVQGAGHRSPLEGRWLTGLEGTVTAVVERPRDRVLWLESALPDGDPATSEGLFVEARGVGLPVAGERVKVGGRVLELARDPGQLPVTTLAAASLERLGPGSPLPPPARLWSERRVPGKVDDDALGAFEPDLDALDFWESLESMRVELPDGVVSGPTMGYGELILLPVDLGGAPATAAGGALLTPEGAPLARAVLSRRLVGDLPRLAVGARVAGPIAGIVDYSFSTYKVLPLAPLAVERPGVACAERTSLVDAPGRLTVATFNLENFSVVGPRERVEGIAGVIARNLAAPAVVALQEVQDDSGPRGEDGVVTAAATLGALVDAVRAAGGPAYETVVIDPELDREGGQPGANIRVALLVDPRRARAVRRGASGPVSDVGIEGAGAEARLTLSPGRVAARSEAFTLVGGEGVRRSLAVELEANGARLFVIVNHWSSKYQDDRDFGAVQPPRRPTASRRLAQAREIRAFVDRLLGADPRARVIVIGDLNDHPWSEPVRLLARPPLENLLLRVAEDRRYTFNFEGAGQALDHVVVSPTLARGAEAEVVHVDADCPDGVRVSDHDPLVVRVRVDG